MERAALTEVITKETWERHQACAGVSKDAEEVVDAYDDPPVEAQPIKDTTPINLKDNPDYEGRLACKDERTSLFFTKVLINEAIELCNSCPAQEDCAEYAIVANEEFGIWGGLSERARRNERKARGLIKSRKKP